MWESIEWAKEKKRKLFFYDIALFYDIAEKAKVCKEYGGKDKIMKTHTTIMWYSNAYKNKLNKRKN